MNIDASLLYSYVRMKIAPDIPVKIIGIKESNICAWYEIDIGFYGNILVGKEEIYYERVILPSFPRDLCKCQ